MIKAAHVPSEKMACQGVITALFNMILLMIIDHYLPFGMLFMQHWGE